MNDGIAIMGLGKENTKSNHALSEQYQSIVLFN